MKIALDDHDASLAPVERPQFSRRLVCPCCNSSEKEELYRCRFDQDPIRGYLNDFYGVRARKGIEVVNSASYVLCRCCACSLIYQLEIGNDALLECLYEDWITPRQSKEKDQHRKLSYHLRSATEIISVLAHLDKNPADVRFFDFGMGWGRWCRLASGFGCQVSGAELSAERISHARSLGIAIVAWDEIPNQRFNFINTEQVFEHLVAPRETLLHLVKALAPGGLLKLSVPNGTKTTKLLQHPDWTAPKRAPCSLNAVAPLEHINCFSRETLLRFGSEAGLQPVELNYGTHISLTRRDKKRKGIRSTLKRLKGAFLRSSSSSPNGQRETCVFFRQINENESL